MNDKENESEFKSDLLSSLLVLEKATGDKEIMIALDGIKNTLIKHEIFEIIPNRIPLFKELSQCLIPEHHSDIHLKVIDIYELIYKNIGSFTLSRDLPFYITGLFSLYPYASSIVKCKILDIFRIYYIPLDKDILPCLSFILSSILSYNESNDFCFKEESLKIIDDLLVGIGERHIYQSLWKIVNLVPSSRANALIYLKMKLPDTCNNTSFIDKYIPNYHKIIPISLLSALNDKSTDVLYNVLDLLKEKFYIGEVKFEYEDIIEIIKSVMKILLFNNANLSNKAIDWLFDFEVRNLKMNETIVNYLVNSIKSLIQHDKMYCSMKILKHLLNLKNDIMKKLLCEQDILLDILYKFKSTNMTISDDVPYDELQEKLIFKNDIKDILNCFPNDIIFNVLGDSCINTIKECIFDHAKFNYYVNIVDYVFACLFPNEKFKHLFYLLKAISSSLGFLLERNLLYDLTRSIKLIKKIIIGIKSDNEKNEEDIKKNIIDIYQHYYNSLITKINLSNSVDEIINTFDESSQLLLIIYSHLMINLQEIPRWFNELLSLSHTSNDFISSISMSTIASLSIEKYQLIHKELIEKHLSGLLNKCWDSLGKSKKLDYLLYNILLQLNHSFGEVCENFIASSIRLDDIKSIEYNIKRFTSLWNVHCEKIRYLKCEKVSDSKIFKTKSLSKAIFILLDNLSDINHSKRYYSKSWLSNSIYNIDIIFDMLFSIILDENTKKLNSIYIKEFECRIVIYVIKLMHSIINCEFMDSLWEVLYNTELTNELRRNFYDNQSYDYGSNEEKSIHNQEINTYLDLLIYIQSMLLCSRPGVNFSTEFKINYLLVQLNSSKLLYDILNKATGNPNARMYNMILNIFSNILDCLKYSVLYKIQNLQINLLSILSLLIRKIDLIENQQKLELFDINKLQYEGSLLNSIQFYDILNMGLLQDDTDYSIKYYWINFIDMNVIYFNNNMLTPVYIDFAIRSLKDFEESNDGIQKKRENIKNILNSLYNIISNQLAHISQSSEINSSNDILEKRLTRRKSLISGLKNIFINQIKSSDIKNGKQYLEFTQYLSTLILHMVKLWSIESYNTSKMKNSDNQENPFLSPLQNIIIRIFDLLLKKIAEEFITGILQHWSFSPFGDDDNSKEFKINCVRILGFMDYNLINILSIILHLFKDYHKAENEHRTSTLRNEYIHQNDSIFTDFLYFYTKFRSNDHILSEKNVEDYLYIIKEVFKSCNPYAIINMFKTLDIFVNAIPESILSNYKVKHKLQRYFSQLTDSIVSIIDQNFIDKTESWKIKINYSIKKSDHEESENTFNIKNSNSIQEDTDFMSNHLLLQSIHIAYIHFAPILSTLFNNDNEKGDSITHKVLFSIISFLEDNKFKIDDENFTCCINFIALLITKLEHHYHLLSYRKDVNLNIIFINSDEFFNSMSAGQLKELMSISKVIYTSYLNDDTHPWNELLKSLNYRSYRNQLKIKHNKNQRVFINKLPFYLKKMAFIILSCPKDEFLEYLPKVQERIIDSTKIIEDEEVTEIEFKLVYELIFICFRVLILKFNEASMKSFWPVIISEMMRCFYLIDKKELIIASLKVLDLLYVLDYEQFSVFEWIFINDYDYSMERVKREYMYIPIIDKFLYKFNEPQGGETNSKEVMKTVSNLRFKTLNSKEDLLKYILLELKNKFDNRFCDKRKLKESIEYELLKDLKETTINYTTT